MVENLGTEPLAEYYDSSLALALSELYPEHEWHPWRFSQTPKLYWKKIDHQRHYFNWLSKELKLKDKEDWYSVSPTLVRDTFGMEIFAFPNRGYVKANVYNNVVSYLFLKGDTFLIRHMADSYTLRSKTCTRSTTGSRGDSNACPVNIGRNYFLVTIPET
jgi:hypothetical protein